MLLLESTQSQPWNVNVYLWTPFSSIASFYNNSSYLSAKRKIKTLRLSNLKRQKKKGKSFTPLPKILCLSFFVDACTSKRVFKYRLFFFLNAHTFLEDHQLILQIGLLLRYIIKKVNISSESDQEMIMMPEFRKKIRMPWRCIGLSFTCAPMSDLDDGCDQVIWTLENFHVVDVNLKHIFFPSWGRVNLTMFQVSRVVLKFEKIIKEW